MNSLLQTIRCIVVSPEVFTGILVLTIFAFSQNTFARIETIAIAIPLLVVCAPFMSLVGYSIFLAKKLLFPTRNASTLIRWPLYPLFRTRIFCGVIFVVVGAAIGIFGFVACGRDVLPAGFGVALYMSGLLVAGIAVFTMFMAQLRIRSVLAGGS